MIAKAIKIAKRSRCGKYAMGCVIVSRINNRVISNGWAHVPNLHRWPLYSLHAEIHALARARDVNLHGSGSTAYIASVSRKSGACTTARPCRNCAIALLAAGITRVVYTVPYKLGAGLNNISVDEIDLLYEIQDIESFKLYNSPQF